MRSSPSASSPSSRAGNALELANGRRVTDTRRHSSGPGSFGLDRGRLRARTGLARLAGGAAIDAAAALRSAVRVRRARVAIAGLIAASRAGPFGARATRAPRPARPAGRTSSRGAARRSFARRARVRARARRSTGAVALAVVPAIAACGVVPDGAVVADRFCAAAATSDVGRRPAEAGGPVVARAFPARDAPIVAGRRKAAAATFCASAKSDDPREHRGADSHTARCIERVVRSLKRQSALFFPMRLRFLALHVDRVADGHGDPATPTFGGPPPGR